MNSLYFLGAIVSFGLGVAFEALVPLGVFFGLFCLLLSASSSLTLFCTRQKKAAIFIGLVFLGFALGVVRFDLARVDVPEFLSRAAGETVTIEGVIVENPDRRASNTQLVVRPKTVALEGTEGERRKSWEASRDSEVRILAFASRYQNYEYGQNITAIGQLEKPENFTGEGGREFDYIHFLAKDDITLVMFYPTIEQTGDQIAGNVIERTLFGLKEKYLSSIARIIPEPESSLLGGLVVGAKQSLGEDWLEKFRETGLIHIVVLSGYNVTLVAYFIMSIFGFLRPSAAAGLSGLGIFAFAVLVGGGATVVRASLMAILVIIARLTGRVADMVRLLFLAGLFMVLWNPYVLLYSPSFQLSFIATFGLLVLGPLLAEKLTFIPERFFLREVVSATIATQIFVLPMLLYLVGEVSLVAVPVNVLALPLVPVVMFFGFFAGMVGFFSFALALPLGYVAYGILSYMLGVVELFARPSFASVSVSQFPLWALAGCYVVYGLVLWLVLRRRSENWPTLS